MILVSKGTYQTNSWSAPFPKKATRYGSPDLDEAFAKTYGQRELLHYVNVHTSIDHTLEQADISWGRISKSAGYYRVETRHVDARKSQNEDKVNHGGRQQRHARGREQAFYGRKGLQVQQKRARSHTAWKVDLSSPVSDPALSVREDGLGLVGSRVFDRRVS